MKVFGFSQKKTKKKAKQQQKKKTQKEINEARLHSHQRSYVIPQLQHPPFQYSRLPKEKEKIHVQMALHKIRIKNTLFLKVF